MTALSPRMLRRAHGTQINTHNRGGVTGLRRRGEKHMIEITFTGFDGLFIGLEESEREFGNWTQEMLSDLADHGQRLARLHVGKDSNRLERSIERTRVRKTATGYEVQVGTKLMHGLWHERGTGVFGPSKRPIGTKTGGLMVFNIGGRRYFLRQIQGQPGRYYMRTAHRQVQYKVRPALHHLVRRVGAFS